MTFWKRKEEEQPEPKPTYSYEIYPHSVADGHHDFEGICIAFWRPGWNWSIMEHASGRWARVHAVGEGFSTRDEALVDILKFAKGLNASLETSKESTERAAERV